MQCGNFRRLPDFSQLTFNQCSGQVLFGLTAAFDRSGGLTVHCGFTNPSFFIDELIAAFQKMSFSNGTQEFGAASVSYSKCQRQTPAFGQTPVHYRTPTFFKTPAHGQTCTFGQTSAHGRTTNFWKTPAFGWTPAHVWTPAFGKTPAFGQTSSFGQNEGHCQIPAFWKSLGFEGAYTGQPSSSIDKLTAAFQKISLSVTTCSRKRPATALCRLGMDTDDTAKMSRPCKKLRCF